MAHTKRILIGVPLGLVALLVICAGLLSTDPVQNYLFSSASKASGRSVDSGQRIHIYWRWPITIFEGHHISLSNFSTGTDPTMFSADKVRVSIDWRHLLKGNVFLPELLLEKPSLLLEKDAKGNANWNFTDNASGAVAATAVTPDDRTDIPGIGRLVIHDGKVLYRDPLKKTDLTLTADTLAGEAGEDENLHLKGSGTYQERKFDLDLQGGNIFQLKDTQEPYPVKAHVAAGGTSADIEGTVLDPIKLKGLDLKLTVKGQDAADMFALIGMALPPTPPYDLTGQLLYEEDVWHFHDFKGRMGDSDLSGFIKWDTSRKRPLLYANFISDKLDFDDLGGFVGATPGVKGDETASPAQRRKAAEAAQSDFVLPDTPLDISRLSAMDADVTFTGRELISQALPLDDFFMHVKLVDSLLKLDPIRFGTAKGDIKAIMTINARENPAQIDGDFHFRRLMLKPIFEKLADKLGMKNVTDGAIGGAARLKGQGKSLREMLGSSNGTIGIGMEGGQVSNLVVELLGLDVAQAMGLFLKGDQPVPIRCFVGDFTVTNGLMQAKTFVFDTTDTNIQGQGHINLKDESMDLQLKAQPKDNTILSLNSPIAVKGTMKHPDINLNFGRLAERGAAATVLAVAFAPAAALAFIEPGLGKDSDCAKLIRQSKSDINRKGGTGAAEIAPKNPPSKLLPQAPRDQKKVGE